MSNSALTEPLGPGEIPPSAGASHATTAVALIPWLALVIAAVALVASRAPQRVPGRSATVDSLVVVVQALTASVDSLRTKVWMLQFDQDLAESHFIGLHDSSIQNIGNDFAVADMAVVREPGGTEVRGVVINTSAVTHRSAEFRLAVSGDTTRVFVPDIPAGGSSHFSGFLSRVNADSARSGELRYISSTVSYHRPF